MASSEKTNSYRNILKGTSFLGGTQIFLILMNLIRGKFIAMLLGPEGMGIANLFTASSNTIQRFSSLGLNLAIVKEVAERKDDRETLTVIKEIAGRLITGTALAGALFCVFFSGWLSRVSFGSDSYSMQFMLLGVAVFFTVAGNGKMSILQGLHEVKALSTSSLIGALTGLIVSVPLYYFWGNAGIVPAMVVFSLVTYAVYSIFLSRKLNADGTRHRISDNRPLVRKLISLGLILMASDLIGSLCNYLLSVFISTEGSLDVLGLYQSANSIITQYLGVIFSAMSLDYFPRLTAAASDNTKMNEIVNRQSLLVSLATAPLAILLIAFTPLVIKILLTMEFKDVAPLMRLFAVGVLFKAYSFPMGYIAFAKGNRTLFFILEGLFGNLLTLGLGCAGFHYFGLLGIGYAMIADFLMCILVYFVVNRMVYGYNFSMPVILNYVIGTVLVVSAYLASGIEEPGVMIASTALIAAVSLAYSFLRLRTLVRSRE